MHKIELTDEELNVLRKKLKGGLGVFANDKARTLLMSVIDKAEKLMEELDAYDELDGDLLYWFYEKYKEQNGIVEDDLRPKGGRFIID